MPRATAKAWSYFEKQDERVAVCLECSKSIRHSGNTSNLHKHLVGHGIVIPSAPKKNVDEAETSLPNASPAKRKRKQTDSNVEASLSPPKCDPKHDAITSRLIYFICKDMRPFFILEGEGFKVLMEELAPTYKVPSMTYIKKKLLEKYDQIANDIKDRLSKTPAVCITLDVWAETLKRNFLGVTVHFIEGTARLNCTVAVKQLPEDYTNEYLSTTLSSIFHEWNIDGDKIKSIVSEGKLNLWLAIQPVVGEKNYIVCFVHTFNAIMEQVLNHDSVIRTVIAKTKAVVRWMKCSPINMERLKQAQENRGVRHAEVNLLSVDMKLHWASVLQTLETFMEVSDIVSEILYANDEEMIEQVDFEILNDLITFTKPFVFASKEILGECYMSGSAIIPVLNILHSRCSYATEYTAVERVKNALMYELSNKFADLEDNVHLAIATLLDPRFKNLHFRDAEACAKAMLRLQAIVRADVESTAAVVVEDAPPSDEFDFWELHRRLIGKRRPALNRNEELTTYLASKVAPLNDDPLALWENMRYAFPHLHKQAMNYLVIVGSLVPNKRVFSRAETALDQSRNRLTTNHLEKLLFLASLSKEEFFPKTVTPI